MSVTICIATYGNEIWEDLAWGHALPSAQDQGCEVLIAHDPEGTRHGVRNALAQKAKGDWLCFLDGDDDLFPDYVAAMEEEIQWISNGRWLLTPAVSYSEVGSDDHNPYLLRTTGDNLVHGNCLVLGTLVERDFFLELGGFGDWNARNGNEFDDWEFWIRCMKAGAKIKQVPDAVYVARLTPTSLNRNTDRRTALEWQYEIGHKHYPDYYKPGWVDSILKRDGVKER